MGKGLGKILGGVAGGVVGTIAGGPAGGMAGAAGGAAAGGAIEGLVGKKKRKRGGRGGRGAPATAPQRAPKAKQLKKAASHMRKATLDQAMHGVDRMPGGVEKRGVFTSLSQNSPPITSLTANDLRAIVRDEVSNFFALYFDMEDEMQEQIEEIGGGSFDDDGQDEF